jgi:hypothetical protein
LISQTLAFLIGDILWRVRREEEENGEWGQENERDREGRSRRNKEISGRRE